jgi:hypothetical protein
MNSAARRPVWCTAAVGEALASRVSIAQPVQYGVSSNWLGPAAIPQSGREPLSDRAPSLLVPIGPGEQVSHLISITSICDTVLISWMFRLLKQALD